MSRRFHRRGGLWLIAVMTLGAAVPLTLTTSGASAGSSAPAGPAGAVATATQTGQAGPPARVNPTSGPAAPSSAQRAALMAQLDQHKAPPLGNHTSKSNVQTSGGPQTLTTGKLAPPDFVRFKTSLVNSTCSGCAQSTINEPSVANNGRFIVEASNWNIAYSTNGASSWGNLNPYAFSSGFCCDQQVVYDPNRNIFLLLQLDYAGEGAASNGLAVSVASGQAPTSWCTYKFPGAIGGGSTDTPDFPKIAVANNNAYITWNDYPPNAGFSNSGLARFPLDSLAACAGFNYNFLTRNTEFTFALSSGPSSLDTFYWVSNWFLDGTVSGSNMRIFYWPERSGTYFTVTRGINAYAFGTVACGSPDWCSRLDPRWESVVITRAEYRAQANSAFAGDTVLAIATTAGPSPFSNGKNYVVYNYFKLNSLAYVTNDQTYSTSTNFAYPGCAVNERGHVGCAMAQGTNAPGGLLVLQDDISPTQPWASQFVTPVNGASAWGDYIVPSTFFPAVGPFQAILWKVNSSNVVEPYYLTWGRGRDQKAYNRWSPI